MLTVGSAAPTAAAAAMEPTGAACRANPATSGQGSRGSAVTAPPPCLGAVPAAPRDQSGHSRQLRVRPVHPQGRRGPAAPARACDPARRHRVASPESWTPPSPPHAAVPAVGGAPTRRPSEGCATTPTTSPPVSDTPRPMNGSRCGPQTPSNGTSGRSDDGSGHGHLPGPHLHGTHPLRRPPTP